MATGRCCCRRRRRSAGPGGTLGCNALAAAAGRAGSRRRASRRLARAADGARADEPPCGEFCAPDDPAGCPAPAPVPRRRAVALRPRRAARGCPAAGRAPRRRRQGRRDSTRAGWLGPAPGRRGERPPTAARSAAAAGRESGATGAAPEASGRCLAASEPARSGAVAPSASITGGISRGHRRSEACMRADRAARLVSLATCSAGWNWAITVVGQILPQA